MGFHCVGVRFRAEGARSAEYTETFQGISGCSQLEMSLLSALHQITAKRTVYPGLIQGQSRKETDGVRNIAGNR